MIKANKIPGIYSLQVSFPYNPEIINLIKSLGSGNCFWDTKAKVWECSITCLAKLLDNLCELDDIQLKLLPDEVEQESIEYPLSKYKTKPFNHQIEAIQYGLNHDSWLLLDAPGLGKTLTTICLAQELKKRDKIKHCLIICGVNSLKHNWKDEIAKHSNLSSMILGQRTTKTGKEYIGSVADRVDDLKHPIKEFFVITNIETIRSDDIMKELTKGKKNSFDMIIVDEVHKCKNPTSTQGKHLLKLTNAKFKIGLTGTILTNNPIDAYVPLKWIGAEHSSYSNFKYYYTVFTGPFNNIPLGYKNIPVLKDQLDKVSLRRQNDILGLPDKNIIHEVVEMDSEQNKFYNNIVNGIVEQVDKVELNTTNLLAMSARLRQATACPSMLTTEVIPSAKINRCVDLCDQIISSGEKVVVFSIFKETLSVLEKELEQYKPLLCTGDIKDTIVNNNKVAFQENDTNMVMLCTAQKMGTGFTLNRAKYAVFIDCPWTAADCEQCEDRIYRIGTTTPVFIYYLWTQDTFDMHVKDIVSDKALISGYIVDNQVPAALSNRLKEIIIDLKETD